MIFERKIYPVGHGGFAVEQIKDGMGQICCTVVFDCGTKPNTNPILNNHINNLKKSGTTTIDALVLSHFDSDHVDGIHTLATTFHVKTVYIPKIPLQHQPLFNALTLNAYDEILLILKDSEIIEVDSDNDISFTNNNWNWKIKSLLTASDWIRLQTVMAKNGLNVKLLNNAQYISQNLQNIKQAYHTIFSSYKINKKGLILLSYASVVIKSCSVSYNNNSISETENACFYTGDAKIKSGNDIQSILPFINGIKLLLAQIPHHGSKSNSDQQFVGLASSLYFYCDKDQNRFSRNTLSQIPHISILFVGTKSNETIINSITF